VSGKIRRVELRGREEDGAKGLVDIVDFTDEALRGG
jgi:hypothetical protein